MAEACQQYDNLTNKKQRFEHTMDNKVIASRESMDTAPNRVIVLDDLINDTCDNETTHDKVKPP